MTYEFFSEDTNRNESGYAIVLAIMMLAVLMMAGLMSSDSSIIDLGIVRNQVIASQNAAAAESAAMTAVQLIENQTDSSLLDPAKSTSDYINADPNDSNYSSDVKTPSWATKTLDMITKRGGDAARYRVIGWSQAKGASLGQYSDNLKDCRIIGEYNSAAFGVYRVELGYRKRF